MVKLMTWIRTINIFKRIKMYNKSVRSPEFVLFDKVQSRHKWEHILEGPRCFYWELVSNFFSLAFNCDGHFFTI